MKKSFIILSLLCCIVPSFAQRQIIKGTAKSLHTETKIAQEGAHTVRTLERAVTKTVVSQIKAPGGEKGISAQPQGLPQNLKDVLQQTKRVTKKVAKRKPQTPPPSTQPRYISPLAMFLSDEPELPSSAWSRSETPYDWATTVANRKASSGHSLEEIEEECLSKGMLPQLIDLIPPTERLAKLTEWLSVYNSTTHGEQGPQRYKDVIAEGNLVATEVEGEEIARIRLQPKFQAVQANYINAPYQDPFNPQVTYMRILAVNDMPEYIAPLQKAAQENKHVTVNIAPTVEAAREALEEAFERHDPYDIVLLDYHGLQGSAADLSKWIHKNTYLSVPVVFYSAARSMPEILFKFNIIGSISIAPTVEEAHQVLNYVSNLIR
ncbi:MAG: hypothetical protein IKP06_04390 [Elusimicrobiaceae bacterium]|nr:hypothetical protein [Elusimicrobiaceae bacterium]